SSLATSIIIRCTGSVGQPANCNDNLSGISPLGVKSTAACYQSSATSGDAVCVFNGVAYPDGGAAAFPICNASSSCGPVASARMPLPSVNASRPSVGLRTGPTPSPLRPSALPSSSSSSSSSSPSSSPSPSSSSSGATDAVTVLTVAAPEAPPLSTSTTTTVIANTAAETATDAAGAAPSQSGRSSVGTKFALPRFLLVLVGLAGLVVC
ncbi:hypothetical protein B0J12DRAFT_270293, partial [Macrophomina phaseolina]